MARGGRRRYSASYRARVEPKLGMTIEEAKRRGISLQAARGHKPREKAALEQRRREKGQLTDPERLFLRQQLKKTDKADDDEFRQRSRDFLESLSPSQREQLIHSQRNLARTYKARRSVARRERRTRRASGGGAGGAGGGGFGGGGGGGGAGGYDFGSGREDFDRWLADEYPDFDDDMDFLQYYH